MAEKSFVNCRMYYRGESAVLGRRMPWANFLFSKIMKVKNHELFT